jgi:hypothetical protein
MPSLSVRSANEVPRPSKSPRAVRDSQFQYESFLHSVGINVGELELVDGEKLQGVKARLRRAATRIGCDVEIWDADGRVYFAVKTKRGRP